MNLREIVQQIVAEKVAKKSNCCYKCGHMHKMGTPCPKPTYSKSDPKHCKNRKK